MNTYDFNGKVALVTGAGSGMGLATAQAFARCGAAVVLADISQDAIDAAAAALNSTGSQALAIRCDVSSEEQVAALVDQTVARFGRLDAAFNSAGVQSDASDASEETIADFERVIGINQRGVWACMKHELRQMKAQGSGAIVNCSSLGGLVGNPGRSIYHGTKHAVIGMTRSAALEYAPRGIRINAICPGTIDTPMVSRMVESGDLDLDACIAALPIGRLGTSEEIADSVLWLCSPGSAFVIGVALPVDGGWTAQ